jgi:hypothetical protein
MGINLGSSTPGNFRLGDTQVNSIWLGNTKVWPLTPTTWYTDFVIGGASCLAAADFVPTASNIQVTGSDAYFILQPNSTLASSAFAFCTTMTSASLPSVSTLSNGVFNSCSMLESFYMPNVNSLSTSAFRLTPIKTVSFPNATSVPSNTFDGCNLLSSASIPNAITIGASSFQNCKALVTASFPNVTTIGAGAFGFCSALKELNFPNTTIIGSSAFYNCSALVSASFPNVTTIQGTSVAAPAFEDCTSLKHIYLPSLSGSNALAKSTFKLMFFNVANNGYMTVPSFFSSSELGGPDPSIRYLAQSPRNWTINYI